MAGGGDCAIGRRSSSHGPVAGFPDLCAPSPPIWRGMLAEKKELGKLDVKNVKKSRPGGVDALTGRIAPS